MPAPCGIPLSVSCHSSLSRMPASSHCRISRSTRGSAILCATIRNSHSWSPLDPTSGLMRVTSGKSRVRESRLPGSVRAKPNGRATRPRPQEITPPSNSKHCRDTTLLQMESEGRPLTRQTLAGGSARRREHENQEAADRRDPRRRHSEGPVVRNWDPSTAWLALVFRLLGSHNSEQRFRRLSRRRV